MGVARFSFHDLCQQPLAARDYLKIAHEFHTIMIDHIPVMDYERRDEAKRFIILIDTLYDNAIKLIASAAAEPDALYRASEGFEAYEFNRTASRLIEMRSQAYLALPHGHGHAVASGSAKGWWRPERLFRFHAGGLHDRRPAPHLVGEERGVIRRRPDLRLEAELCHAGGQLRRPHRFVGLDVELVDDVGRRAGGREQTAEKISASSGKPLSTMVGTSGRSLLRVRVVTASAGPCPAGSAAAASPWCRNSSGCGRPACR
jgi:hypothetical protein